jgi:hypothetical protein
MAITMSRNLQIRKCKIAFIYENARGTAARMRDCVTLSALTGSVPTVGRSGGNGDDSDERWWQMSRVVPVV